MHKILSSLLTLLCIPLLTYAQSPPSKSPTSKESIPLLLPKSYDRELENLLEKWYDGYTRRGTNIYLSSVNQPDNLPVPQTPDSIYVGRMNKIPSAIRLSYNAQVREAIELYLYKRRNLLSLMLTQADLYFPEIETALDKKGLPLELKYLTIVESALNPSAVSPAGAAGLWQLMLPTGKIYGLTVNSLIDERLDPFKSTEAACKLLTDLHNIYNDWWLAIAAYNCGPGTVNKAIRRAGSNARNFWDIYEYLPRETRRYIPLFIGAYYAMFYHDEYNIKPRELGKPLSTDYYQVKEALSFDKISELTGLSRELIVAFNPQYRRGIVPGNTTTCLVRLPITAIMKLEGQTEGLSSPELAVKIEDDATASRYGKRQKEEVKESSVTAEEEEEEATTSKKGKKNRRDKADKKEKGKKRETSKSVYKVRKGDTLASIARKHNMSVKQLKKLNGISSDKLSIGQKVHVK